MLAAPGACFLPSKKPSDAAFLTFLMPVMTLNLGYLLQQAMMFAAAGIGAGLVLLVLAGLRRIRLWPRNLVVSLLLETLVVAGALAGAELYAYRKGWLQALPGWPSMFMIVALCYYWGIVFWPVRVFWLRKRIRGHKGSRLVFGAAIFAPLLGFYASFVEPNWLDAEPVTLQRPEVRGAPIRIAHFSDLQLVDFGFRERTLISTIAEFRPHLVIMTGDYINAQLGEDTAIAAARTVIANLHPTHGIYATPSDSNSEAQARKIFRDLPVHYLVNKSLTVEVLGTSVRVGGVNHSYPRWDLLRREATSTELFLVACHNPDLAEECRERIPEADIFFCGHTHGGQLQVPFYGPLITLTQRISRQVAAGGVFTTGNGMPMLLSRGVGMEAEYSPRFRLNCRPHLFLVTLRGTEDS